MQNRIPVGILGATGSVGQRFVQLLDGHPWFEVVSVAASEKSAGKKYAEAVNWFLPQAIPEQVAALTLAECEPDLPCRIVFSGLDARVAGEVEEQFANHGYLVVSNSKNHRMDPKVPLLVPEVNSDHLSLLKQQDYANGHIVTNPNCSTVGLVLALKPLQKQFQLDAVHVVTMQALSGAGFPGVPSLAAFDNVIPYIGGEEEKLEMEPRKILGTLASHEIRHLDVKISAHCNRVPVADGHLECVSVKLKDQPSSDDIVEAWTSFRGEPQALQLPFAPEQPIHYFQDQLFPQPKLHREIERGMAVCIGRLRECSLFDYKFVLLVHNTIRGAAGGAILNAELIVKKGLLDEFEDFAELAA